MSQVLEQTPPAAATDGDLTTALLRVLRASAEPLTLSKIRSALPAALRPENLDELADLLRRQVAANTLHAYPPYRSQQDRFWDRPMPVHVAALLSVTLEEGSLPLFELRRKMPAYAHTLLELVLQEQLAAGLLHRHPRTTSRGGERYGVRPPDAREYLRPELQTLFTRLAALGFSQAQLRASALELLHEEEWSSETPSETEPRAAAPQESEVAADGELTEATT